MDELTIELIGLMNTVDLWKQNSFHTTVGRLNYFSPDYLKKVRKGDRSIKDTLENREIVKTIIKTYEVLLWRHKKIVGNITVNYQEA
jgi:hypothetical protein